MHFLISSWNFHKIFIALSVTRFVLSSYEQAYAEEQCIGYLDTYALTAGKFTSDGVHYGLEASRQPKILCVQNASEVDCRDIEYPRFSSILKLNLEKYDNSHTPSHIILPSAC